MTPEPEPCKSCQITRIVPTYPLFNLGCLHCGARIIQHLATLPIPATQVASRRKDNLAHWVAFGHSEAQIRALAKQTASAVAPLTPAISVASAPQKSGKRR